LDKKKTRKDHPSLFPNSALSINTYMFVNRMKMWFWSSKFFNCSRTITMYFEIFEQIFTNFCKNVKTEFPES